jgi:hypothetical protein
MSAVAITLEKYLRERAEMRQKITPRLLTKAEAASYCGLGTATFENQCPVRPIALGHSKRLMRFDREALNAWIDELASGIMNKDNDWLAKMDDQNDRCSG